MFNSKDTCLTSFNFCLERFCTEIVLFVKADIFVWHDIYLSFVWNDIHFVWHFSFVLFGGRDTFCLARQMFLFGTTDIFVLA